MMFNFSFDHDAHLHSLVGDMNQALDSPLVIEKYLARYPSLLANNDKALQTLSEEIAHWPYALTYTLESALTNHHFQFSQHLLDHHAGIGASLKSKDLKEANLNTNQKLLLAAKLDGKMIDDHTPGFESAILTLEQLEGYLQKRDATSQYAILKQLQDGLYMAALRGNTTAKTYYKTLRNHSRYSKAFKQAEKEAFYSHQPTSGPTDKGTPSFANERMAVFKRHLKRSNPLLGDHLKRHPFLSTGIKITLGGMAAGLVFSMFAMTTLSPVLLFMGVGFVLSGATFLITSGLYYATSAFYHILRAQHVENDIKHLITEEIHKQPHTFFTRNTRELLANSPHHPLKSTPYIEQESAHGTSNNHRWQLENAWQSHSNGSDIK